MASTQELNALFKEVYADRLERLVPDSVVLQKDIKFSEADKVGDKFIQPVMLSEEQGFTYSTSDTEAFTLENAITADYRDAAVDGVNLVLKSQISYAQAAKAAGGGAKSFEAATSRMLEALRVSVAKRLEILMLYGEDAQGIGRVNATVNVTQNTAVNVPIKADEWADGIWAGAENMLIDVYQAATNTVRNRGVINSVNPVAKTLNVTFTASGTNLAANDTIFFSKSKGNTFLGLHQMLTGVTGSDTKVFGIDQAKYSLWKGNQFNVAAKLSVAKILEAASIAVGRGLSKDCNLYVNHKVYESLNASLNDTNRRIDSSYSVAKQQMGSKMICVNYQGGVINVKPSIYIKEQEGYLLPMGVAKRIGAQDVSFRTPGFDKDHIFHRMESKLGYAVRCYTHQAIFVEKPAHCVVLTGITL